MNIKVKTLFTRGPLDLVCPVYPHAYNIAFIYVGCFVGHLVLYDVCWAFVGEFCRKFVGPSLESFVGSLVDLGWRVL